MPNPRSRKHSKSAKSIIRLTALTALWLLVVRPIPAWGPTGHSLVNNWAVQTLPSEMRAFFDANRQYLVEHADDPDVWMKKDRYERKRHYIYLDKYGIFPFLEVPHSFKQAVQNYGSGRVNRDGVLPWQVGESSLRLTEAFKSRNWDRVKLAAAVLAHYVADAHDPLHLTRNFDGQLTRQTGLDDRFEVRLLDRYSRFFILHPEDAVKIEDPTEYAFQACLEAYTSLDSVILADMRARERLPDYTDEYFDRFYSQIGATVMRAINDSAHDAGSYWYTAWLNAGKPSLPAR
ncbi:MAG: hypothetical protein ABSF46_22490 [Terriglobia bacterium]|jgi:hypothetical protein